MAEQHRHRRVPGISPAVPTVHTLEVIRVAWVTGEGCCLADPVRQIISYYQADTGDHLWTQDDYTPPLENDGSSDG